MQISAFYGLNLFVKEKEVILSDLINLIVSSNPIFGSDFIFYFKEKEESSGNSLSQCTQTPLRCDCQPKKNLKIHDHLGNQLQAFF